MESVVPIVALAALFLGMLGFRALLVVFLDGKKPAKRDPPPTVISLEKTTKVSHHERQESGHPG